jgi:hypothetical protein
MSFRVKRTARHNGTGRTSGRNVREFVACMITEAAQNTASTCFSEEDALELLCHLDNYTRVWGSAIALACFRKLLSAGAAVWLARREDDPHVRRIASPGVARECAGNEVLR